MVSAARPCWNKGMNFVCLFVCLGGGNVNTSSLFSPPALAHQKLILIFIILMFIPARRWSLTAARNTLTHCPPAKNLRHQRVCAVRARSGSPKDKEYSLSSLHLALVTIVLTLAVFQGECFANLK